jgi:glycosyltransferase involved in cell wall biosynthesis
MLWIPKLFGKRCVATIHGLDHQREKWGIFAGTYLRLGERCAVKYADEIIVLSKNMQKYFLNKYKRETRYIPNGVNPPNIRKPNLIRQKYHLEKDSYILFLGRVVPEKGLRYLIQAFKMVKTDKKLVIAGGSSDTTKFYHEIKNLAAADDRIVFTGFVEGAELEELYSNSFVYVLPSDVEGMPLSLLEALSYGNCCLISDIPECAEVVENRGVMFRKSDVSDLQKKLQKLCDNPAITQKYKNSASENIHSKHCWEMVLTETLGIYGFAID